MNVFKKIDIGKMIKQRVTECELTMERICDYFKCAEEDVEQMFLKKSLDSKLLLQWSKLLKYDFFRIYSQHLILYAPSSGSGEYKRNPKLKSSSLPELKKSIYTKEIIDFILELIRTKEKSPVQVINEYNIPKTTLHRWIQKYSRIENNK